MRLNRKILALALVSALVTGCGSGSGGGSNEDSDAVLRVGSTYTCSTTNPFATIDVVCLVAFRYNYPYLFQYDDVGEVIPDFATNSESSADGLTWTIDVQPDAKWSDGEPLTAEDVAFGINTTIKYKDGATSALSSWITNIADVEATSSTQVVITYDKPTANVTGRLAMMPILPQHVFEELATGDGMALKTTEFPMPLVAGGPFQIAKFTKDQIVQLKPNPNFYGDKPKFGGVGFQTYTSPDAMVNALKNDQIDYAAPVPVTAVDGVEDDSTLTVTETKGFQYHEMIINQSEYQEAHPELRDAKVKEAFELAIDREQIIETAYLGHGEVGGSIVPPADGKWYNTDITPAAFDLDKANALLDEAGYAKGPDGIRIANGQPMSYDFILMQTEGGEGERAYQIVAEDLKSIGIEIKPQMTDSASGFSQIVGDDNKYNKFTLAGWAWIANWDPDFILSVMTCAQWGGWSDSGYCNPEYDKLYEQQAETIDEDARKEIVWQMQQMIYDARPYIVTLYQNNVEAHSNAWTGFGKSPRGIYDSQSRTALTSVTKTS